MAQTRANPIDQLLDVFHEDSNTWARAVALIQIAGGLDVGLTGLQGQFLADINTNAAKISDLLSVLNGLSTSSSAIVQQASQIAAALDATTNSNLAAITQLLVTLQVQNAELTGDTGAIANLLETGYNYNLRFDELLSLLTTHSTAFTNIKSSTDAVGTKIDAVRIAVDARSAKSVTHRRVSFTGVDTESIVALPPNTRDLRLRSRKVSGTAYDLRYSFEQGQVEQLVSGRYSSLLAGMEYVQTDLNLTDTILYLSSSTATAIAEVEIYS